MASDPTKLVGGPALKRAIHTARARAGIISDMQLSIQAGVHYDTFMNWYSDRTVPRPAEVKKVADVLDISYGDLMAAYEGREPAPAELQDAIRELVEELRQGRAQQTEATVALLQALRELVPAARERVSAPSTSETETVTTRG